MNKLEKPSWQRHNDSFFNDLKYLLILLSCLLIVSFIGYLALYYLFNGEITKVFKE